MFTRAAVQASGPAEVVSGDAQSSGHAEGLSAESPASLHTEAAPPLDAGGGASPAAGQPHEGQAEAIDEKPLGDDEARALQEASVTRQGDGVSHG